MSLIVNVTPGQQEASLSRLVELPLGLDVWELTEQHAVGRAEPAHVRSCMRRMTRHAAV